MGMAGVKRIMAMPMGSLVGARPSDNLMLTDIPPSPELGGRCYMPLYTLVTLIKHPLKLSKIICPRQMTAPPRSMQLVTARYMSKQASSGEEHQVGISVLAKGPYSSC